MSSRVKKDVAKLIPLALIMGTLLLVLMVLPQAVRYMGRAKGIPANIVVDTQAVLGEMPRPWRNLAQGGEESEPMFDDVTDKLKALKPEYIRIDHLYDIYQVVSRDGSSLKYDWSKLDRVVDDITRAGARPMLSLSYMPPVISKSDIIDQPKDWGEWEAVVQATVEHYSGTGGKNIDMIYYEVWNEPDLFGSFKTYGDKNYLNLYAHSVAGINRARGVRQFKVGGPATTALYKAWVDNFLNFVVKNNLRLDFYSWHRYNTDLAQYEKDAQQIETWLEAHPEKDDLELCITEWGHNSEIDKGYDGTFGAIHTIAASRVMMGRIDRGFVFEIKDGPGATQYWGRWGLLTHEKWGTIQTKPRFNALLFLNQLGNERLSLAGEGSWVRGIGAVKNGVIQTMLINYDPTGKHSEGVPVRFENLPSGNFTYKRTDFLGGVKSQTVATSSAEWATVEFMKPNSAAMLELNF